MKSLSEGVIRGVVQRPGIYTIYGDMGVGKTHLASRFCDEILSIDLEKGSDYLPIDKVQPENYPEVLHWLNEATKSTHYKAVMIDSLTKLQAYAQDQICQENGWVTLEDPGYGRGLKMYRQTIEKLRKGLEKMRDKGKNIIILAHTRNRQVNNPTQQPFERVELAFDEQAQNTLLSVADFCFYLRVQVRTSKDKESNSTRTYVSGARELIMEDKGGCVAKGRLLHLPDVVEFPHEKDLEKLNKMYTDFWQSIKK